MTDHFHTDKHRRRRHQQQVAHAARVKRRQAEASKEATRRLEYRRREDARLRELAPERRRLVQVLANRLYTLSPEHAKRARFEKTLGQTRAFLRALEPLHAPWPVTWPWPPP